MLAPVRAKERPPSGGRVIGCAVICLIASFPEGELLLFELLLFGAGDSWC
jgi:hypothetical protein